MPEKNCHQANAWCPHYDKERCRPVSENDAPCIHAKALRILRAQLSIFAAVYKEKMPSDLKHEIGDLLSIS